MRDLVPIKIKAILSKNSNEYTYPDLSSLPREITKGLKAHVYFDRYGTGMLYDPCEMGAVDDEVPEYDVRYCGSCVPRDFAMAAAKSFSRRVTILTPTEWELWYDTRVARDQPDEIVDLDVLQAIEVKEALKARGLLKKLEDQEAIKNALDPDHHAQGIRKNFRKTWARLSKHAGVRLINPHA